MTDNLVTVSSDAIIVLVVTDGFIGTGRETMAFGDVYKRRVSQNLDTGVRTICSACISVLEKKKFFNEYNFGIRNLCFNIFSIFKNKVHQKKKLHLVGLIKSCSVL